MFRVAGSKLKNKVFYKNYKLGEYKNPPVTPRRQPETESVLKVKESGESREPDDSLLHVIPMGTEPVFSGLPFYFEDDYPRHNENLAEHVPADDYNLTIMAINFKVSHYTPCPGSIVCFVCSCPLSCGLTLLPLFRAGKKAIREVEEIIRDENEEKYTKNGVEWKFCQDEDKKKSRSWIEIRLIDQSWSLKSNEIQEIVEKRKNIVNVVNEREIKDEEDGGEEEDESEEEDDNEGEGEEDEEEGEESFINENDEEEIEEKDEKIEIIVEDE